VRRPGPRGPAPWGPFCGALFAGFDGRRAGPDPGLMGLGSPGPVLVQVLLFRGTRAWSFSHLAGRQPATAPRHPWSGRLLRGRTLRGNRLGGSTFAPVGAAPRGTRPARARGSPRRVATWPSCRHTPLSCTAACDGFNHDPPECLSARCPAHMPRSRHPARASPAVHRHARARACRTAQRTARAASACAAPCARADPRCVHGMSPVTALRNHELHRRHAEANSTSGGHTAAACVPRAMSARVGQ
jgi:hypothetical protein